MMEKIKITPATSADEERIWALLQPVFSAGDTYAVDPLIDREAAIAYWMEADKTAFILRIEGQAVGTYYIRPNQPGGGAHICNCGFITAPSARGKGVARRMLDHALIEAKQQGYRAMQFNFVLASNQRALAIWQRNGFATIGRIPQAFLHPKQGYVDALILHRSL
ncbi:MAG: GNAT family N-acetyltransferase [Paracoccaceae bacterium]|jgi:GNAT superfamily N-acetyltransferase|tara:strand:- start:468 stop:962 length:495 start_codon:yes stop_codon:yes gene_type:complete